MDLGPDSIQKLAELLRPPEPEVLQGEDYPSQGYDITSNRDKLSQAEKQDEAPRTIEEFEEQEAKQAERLGDVGAGIGGRKTPHYTMNYQQAVSAEDVYLQIGPKTTSSASCENLIIRIKMPGEKMENVDLDVDTASVTVNSSKHYLKLPLPHAVNPDMSNATWDREEDTLVLKLRLDREFDFVNF